ncbi:ribbon-helix-helix domain-containing protein [Archaeoglobus sp.]
MTAVKNKNHIGISLPKTLVDQIKEAIKRHPDYASIAEFVKDAVRRRLEELGFYKSGSSPHSDMVGEEGDKRCRG